MTVTANLTSLLPVAIPSLVFWGLGFLFQNTCLLFSVGQCLLYDLSLCSNTHLTVLRALEVVCVTVCDFRRPKKCSKLWSLGSLGSLWENPEYEDGQNFKLSGIARLRVAVRKSSATVTAIATVTASLKPQLWIFFKLKRRVFKTKYQRGDGERVAYRACGRF